MPPGKGLGKGDGMDRRIMSGDLQFPSAGSAQCDASVGSVDSAPARQQGALHHQASTESSTGSGGLEPPRGSERPRRSAPRPHQSGGHAGRADPDGPPCTSPVRRQQAHSRWAGGPGSKGGPCSSTLQPRQTRRLSDLMLCRPDVDSSVAPLRFSRRLAVKHRPGPGTTHSSGAASSLAEHSELGHAPSTQNLGRVSSPAGRPELIAHASPGRATTPADRPRAARGKARGLRPTAREHGSSEEEEQEEQPAAGTSPLGPCQRGSGAVTAMQATAVLAAAVEESGAQDSQRPRSDAGQAQTVPAAGAAEPELQGGSRKRPRLGEQSSLEARSLAPQLGGPHKRPRQQEATVAAEQRRAAAAATAAAAKKKQIAEAAALVAEQRRAAAAQAQQQRAREDRFLEALNQVCPSWRLCDAAPAVEPERAKGQWDFMLEEARWLAADFAQERLWKQAASRSLAHACAGPRHSWRLRSTGAACLADITAAAERVRRAALPDEIKTGYEAAHAQERAQRSRRSWPGVCVKACMDRCSLQPYGGGTCSHPHPADGAPQRQPAELTLTYWASRGLPAALAEAAQCAEDDCIINGALDCHQHADDVAEAIAGEKAGQEEDLAVFLAELRAPQLHPDCYPPPGIPLPACKPCRPAPHRRLGSSCEL
eukprot:jgi/Astpho2/6797/fgenesh1_pg.00103_%23_22_t